MAKQKLSNFSRDTLRIVPFGGCGEFGMNMTAYIVEDRIYLVDAGVSFPDPSRLGVESIFPDIDEYLQEFGGVYAYIITHGHEDHIGALPYLLEKWPGPIYAPPWAAALITNKLERREVGIKYPIQVVKAGETISTEDFEIEYVHMNHSIPDACALYIKHRSLKVFHTGDFKFDHTPVLEAPANIKRLREIGDQGIDLLLSDSTNAHIKGPSPSESVVIEPMRKAISSAEGAAIVTTFSSNFWRLKTVMDVAADLGKKVVILGSGVDSSLRIASDLDIYKAKPGIIIDPSAAQSLPRNQIVVICTGSQGEWRAALMKLALGEHRAFSLLPKDLVIFSSRTIPGNERVIQNMMSLLERRGAKIFSIRNDPNIHVSGHGYRDDVKLMLDSIRPRNFIPVHGTFSHLSSSGQIPGEEDFKTNTYLVENGEVIDLDPKGVVLSERVDVGHWFIDSESYLPLSYETLRERLRVGESGQCVLSAVVSEDDRRVVGRVSVQLVGLPPPYGDEIEDVTRGIEKVAKKALNSSLQAGQFNEAELIERMRVETRRHLHSIYGKKPVVIAQVHVLAG